MSALTVAVSLFANDRGRSGIGRYLINVLSALSQQAKESLDHVRLRCFVAREDLDVFQKTVEADGDWLQYVPVHDRWNAPPASVLWHLLEFPRQARKLEASVLYLPAGNRRLAPLAHIPCVAVVHDLSAFHVKGKYDPARMLYIKKVLPWMMRRTSHIIAISQATANDILTLAHFPGERMTIVGNGYDARVFYPKDPGASRAALVSRGLLLPEKYLLYVSRLEHPGKNHVGLLKAYRLLLDRVPAFPFDLVFAGGRWNGAEVVEKTITDLGLDNRVHTLGYVDDAALPHLYACARALVFPSLFEGFGLPILEAQGSGLPVAASRISSIPEVVGDGGLLFDPHNPDEIQGSIERISLDEPLREELVRKGLDNATAYTWESTAKRTLNLLREASVPCK